MMALSHSHAPFTGRSLGARFARLLACTLLLGAIAVPGTAGTAIAQERQVPKSEAEITLSFAPVVKKVAPAVVNVYATRMVEQRQASPFLDDPFFRRFFGVPDNVPGGQRKRVQSSLGSGVIISPEGIIITNNHVIENADEVRVALSDRREFDADIILKDERTDLAVLKIREGGKFPTVEFADSDGLEVGDMVLAIGNPFGVGQTVTQGIVSALARTQVGVTDYQFFIQTDAAINPGNSGGALVDMHGRLVGINTAIFSRSGGSIGIGFAIPANMVHFIATSAQTSGKVQRPWLGASVQVVGAEIAEALGLDRPRGVLLTKVFPGSPAEKAGLKVGDLVTAVDGAEVLDPDSFGYRFATKQVGGEVKFSVLRSGKEQEAEVALVTAPETPPRDARKIDSYSPFAGATVLNLSPAVSDELRLDTMEEGVVIGDVAPGSPANQVGLKAGDIIVGVNEQKVTSTAELDRMLKRPARFWLLDIKRGGEITRLSLRG